MSCREGKCCSRIEERKGIITIGCIWLLGDALILIWFSYVTYLLDAAVRHGTGDRIGHFLGIAALCMAVICVVLYSVAVLLDIVLLVGVITVRRRLLECWMGGYPVAYVIVLAIAGFNVTAGYFSDHSHQRFIATGMLLHVGPVVCFWIMVYRYYPKVSQQCGEEEPSPTADRV